ncbi:Oxidoreductase [Linderina pennispora]|nr:Oxidoreductase [Linderina pennispora]
MATSLDNTTTTLDSVDLGAREEPQQQQEQEQAKEEKESKQQDDSPSQAFDPETGEINWDCPCLGGMAHGTCGEEFKSAFSCFVYSEEEPKGMDCIDKFKAMQDCFRAHPEEYGDELLDDDEDEQEPKEELENDTDIEDNSDDEEASKA